VLSFASVGSRLSFGTVFAERPSRALATGALALGVVLALSTTQVARRLRP
jgi:hypothetical protein